MHTHAYQLSLSRFLFFQSLSPHHSCAHAHIDTNTHVYQLRSATIDEFDIAMATSECQIAVANSVCVCVRCVFVLWIQLHSCVENVLYRNACVCVREREREFSIAIATSECQIAAANVMRVCCVFVRFIHSNPPKCRVCKVQRCVCMCVSLISPLLLVSAKLLLRTLLSTRSIEACVCVFVCVRERTRERARNRGTHT